MKHKTILNMIQLPFVIIIDHGKVTIVKCNTNDQVAKVVRDSITENGAPCIGFFTDNSIWSMYSYEMKGYEDDEVKVSI